MVVLLSIARSTGWMLPYDGIIRTGSKGVSHSGLKMILAETPSEGARYWKEA
jgi:hypothetical protein